MEAWRPEQLEGVRLLKEFITNTKSHVLLVLAKHDMQWHAENGQPAEVAKGVSEALALIPPSLDLDIATALTNALWRQGSLQYSEDLIPLHEAASMCAYRRIRLWEFVR